MSDDMDARPEAWDIDLIEHMLDFGDASPDRVFGRSDFKEELNVPDRYDAERVARLPVTEWERDRAVELLQSLVEQIDDQGPSGWWGIYKHTERRVRDLIREIEGGERG